MPRLSMALPIIASGPGCLREKTPICASWMRLGIFLDILGRLCRIARVTHVLARTGREQYGSWQADDVMYLQAPDTHLLWVSLWMIRQHRETSLAPSMPCSFWHQWFSCCPLCSYSCQGVYAVGKCHSSKKVMLANLVSKDSWVSRNPSSCPQKVLQLSSIIRSCTDDTSRSEAFLRVVHQRLL